MDKTSRSNYSDAWRPSGQTIAIIQARMGSTRLPGKVLAPLGQGRCLLQWVIDRLRQSQRLDRIVVATTTDPADDQLVQQCRQWSVDVFRGSVDDVLARFYDAAVTYQADIVVRVNADNPFVDPFYIDQLIERFVQSDVQYMSYESRDGRPVMLTALSFFTECLSMACLAEAYRTLTQPRDREHVTLGVYSRPERFSVAFLPVPACCDNPDLRLTLDTQADLQMLGGLIDQWGPASLQAGVEDVIKWLRSSGAFDEWMKQQNALNPKTY